MRRSSPRAQKGITPHTTFRLSPEARGRLQRIAKKRGITMTAVLELAIRNTPLK